MTSKLSQTRPGRAAASAAVSNIVAKATEVGVPVRPDDVKVSRDGQRTVAQGSYIQTVDFFPNYPWPVKFTFVVDALSLAEPSGSRRK